MDVQSYMSLVEMLLLLLSGDIESNPGPIIGESDHNVLYKIMEHNIHLLSSNSV